MALPLRKSMSLRRAVQLNFGLGAGRGCAQLYTRHLGRATGNLRVAIGSTEKLKAFRDILLRSQWFSDATGVAGASQREVAQVVCQPQGTMLLPHLTTASKDKDINGVLVKIATRLPEQGRKAMKQYLEHCGLKDDSRVKAIMEKALEKSVPAKGASKKAAGKSGRPEERVIERPLGSKSGKHQSDAPGE